MSTLLVPYHLDEAMPELPEREAGRVVEARWQPGEFWQRVAPLHQAVAEVVAGTEKPVVLAGDCTVALGVVAGLQRMGVQPTVLWVDAHGDLHTPESSTSGYAGGMPLRMLLGDGDSTVADKIGLRPVPADRVVLVGARDLDPPEAEYLATSPVTTSRVEDIGVPEGPIYLHIDLDVIDATQVPGLRYPAGQGPTQQAVREAASRVLDTGRVQALTLVCSWRPGEGAADAVRPLIDALAS
ncbi:arginase family protein [Amycolatopsis sp. YIM 10]|uniref:arginase family protein n=1 Tax=Amycolatopsis sp. YIM 10 TaxID=2653857 RepID=UPI0012905197|nr:arginase family protein [Amycolatopsis sp. YIM 10]QFU87038.1 Arginase [Amycolatopsis sp. YIM 10]